MGLTLAPAHHRRPAVPTRFTPPSRTARETCRHGRCSGGRSRFALVATGLAIFFLAGEIFSDFAFSAIAQETAASPASAPAESSPRESSPDAASAPPACPQADEAEDAFARWKRLTIEAESLAAGIAIHTQVGDLIDRRAARLSPARFARLLAAVVEVDRAIVPGLCRSGKFPVALGVQTRLAGWLKQHTGPQSPETIEAQSQADDLIAIVKLNAAQQRELASQATSAEEVLSALGRGEAEDVVVPAERSVEKLKSLLPADHLDLAAARARVGMVHLARGQFAEAVGPLEAALASYRRRFGERHPALGDVLVALADAYAQSERWKDAAPLYTLAAATTKEYHGEESVDYAQRLSQHAWGARQAKELSLAAKLYNDATKRLRTALGEESPELIDVLIEFGDLRCDQESYEEALPHFQEAVELSRTAHGRETVEHAGAMYRVALCHDRLSEFAVAEAGYREALAILDALEEPDFDLQGVVLDNLGLMHDDMKEPERSEPLHRRAWTLRKEHFGETHVDTLASAEALGLTLAALDRFDEGEPLLVAVLEARRADPGPESEEFAATAHLLGRECREHGKLAEAATRLKDALAAWKTLKGETSAEYSSAVFDFAEVKRAQGDHRGALHWHRLALAARRTDNGAVHEETLGSLTAVGSLMLEREEFSDAEDAFQQALEAAETLHGRDTQETAGLLYSLGRVYRRWGEVGLAILYLHDAATVLDAAEERRGREFAEVARELAGAYREIGAAVPAKRWLGLAEEAAGAGVADDPLIAERALILVERARFGLAFFHSDDPARRPTSLPTPTATPIAWLDKAAVLAAKLEKSDADLEAAIALARAKDAVHSSTAATAAQRAVEKARAACGQDQSAFGEALYLSALAHLKAGEFDDAESQLLEVVTIFVERLGDESLPYAEAVEQLAALWRRTNRLDDSIPLTLAAFKARYRSAATNLPHLADLGLQALYLDRCLDTKRAPSPGAINLLRPNDARLAAECARWSIALRSLREESRRSRDPQPVGFQKRFDHFIPLETLKRERAGQASPDDSKRLDEIIAASPEWLERPIDDRHPVHTACDPASLSKAISPSGAAVELVLVSPLSPDGKPVEPRCVAWIVSGVKDSPVVFLDLGTVATINGVAKKPAPKPPFPTGVEPPKEANRLAIPEPEKVLALLRAEPSVAAAKTLYISSLLVLNDLNSRPSTREKQRVVCIPNLARLLNDLPPASQPVASDLPTGAGAPVERSKDRKPVEAHPADWIRPAPNLGPAPNPPPVSKAGDSAPAAGPQAESRRKDGSKKHPFPRTDDVERPPASTGN